MCLVLRMSEFRCAFSSCLCWCSRASRGRRSAPRQSDDSAGKDESISLRQGTAMEIHATKLLKSANKNDDSFVQTAAKRKVTQTAEPDTYGCDLYDKSLPSDKQSGSIIPAEQTKLAYKGQSRQTFKDS